MSKKIRLTENQIEVVKQLADETRKSFGVYNDVPLGNHLFGLVERDGVILCQYPFERSEGSHVDATITWFETKYGPMTFIGLNTELYLDEQIFALAHEWYHYLTRTGKAYHQEVLEEDDLTEKKADRFAAELLLPREPLRSRVMLQFQSGHLDHVPEMRLFRFIARLQKEWQMPYRSIVLRLYEEGYIGNARMEQLFEVQERNPADHYHQIFSSIAPEYARMLNTRTRCTDISSHVLEIVIQNYEDGLLTDDAFAELLARFGKSPEALGFDLVIRDDMEELSELFGEDGANES